MFGEIRNQQVTSSSLVVGSSETPLPERDSGVSSIYAYEKKATRQGMMLIVSENLT
jgi:hypothetical protein